MKAERPPHPFAGFDTGARTRYHPAGARKTVPGRFT